MGSNIMVKNNYITYIDGEKKGFRYGSDLAVYTERFIDGRLLCADYRDNGIPTYERYEKNDKTGFDLVIDGESIYFGWEFIEFTSEKTNNGNALGTLILQHTIKPITLKVITECCGFGYFRRYMEIINTSDEKNIGLTSVTPLMGILWQMSDKADINLRDGVVAPYSIGYFKGISWTTEGDFAWEDVPRNTEMVLRSNTGKSGHNSPYFILRNNVYGGYFVCQLGWSANWEASAYYIHSTAPWETNPCLHFKIAPISPSPARMIRPGETIKIPEVHFGITHYDFNTAVQNLHSHLRKNVLRIVGDGLQPVIYNHWGYMEHEISEDKLKEEIDIASEIGAELFMVDAGWYGNKCTPWDMTTGNWYTGDRLPNDLFPIFEYARRKGLKCGLWVEIESAGDRSELAKEHPEWFIKRYGKSVERVLDLAKPAVRDYVESELNRIIEKYDLDMLRLDYNLLPAEGGFNQVNGINENTLWRHVEAVYEIFDRIGKRYPDLQLENCASGGGRIDTGILSRFTTTWVSDWMKMPRTVKILNGMSLMLPPEYINRTFGAVSESYAGGNRGNTETQLHAVIMAHPAISGITHSLAEANLELMRFIKKYIKIYKEFIRPFQRETRVYHHMPVIQGLDGTGWCALEYVSQDQKRAVTAVFKLVNAEKDVYQLKFKGLKENFNYRIRIEPGEKEFNTIGYSLLQDGLDISLDNALTSKLIMLTAE